MALIYVIEDDRSIQEIETFALLNVGYRVEGFDCARDFYAALERELPELIVLDIMLPDEDGLSIVKKLREDENTWQIPVIMVSAKSTELDKVKGLDMGADDYLTKPFGVMELISRVKALLRRIHKPEEASNVLCIGCVMLDKVRHAVYVQEEACELTYKEYELLKLLMENAGIVMAREVILDCIWGIDYQGESRTLDMHIKTLRQKLKSGGALIKTVRNVGYVMNYEA
ncbi:MAG: response regulator transcription factor [Roseburia sp.]|nr:response regulator transcription factor [Roseburia sp.]